MMKCLRLLLLLLVAEAAAAQVQPVTAILSQASSNCQVANSCVVLPIPSGVASATFTVTSNPNGNTLVFEVSGDGGQTWVAAATSSTSTSATGSFQASIAAFTQARIRMSVSLAGFSMVTITPSTASAGGGSSGSISGGLSGVVSITNSGQSCGTTPNCFPGFFDVQYAYAVTCNNTSTAIATGSGDPPFVASDVTKIIAGHDNINGDSAANCPPQGTITVFTDAHHVSVSNPATATTTTGALAWGHDENPNSSGTLSTAFAASLGKGCLYLPQGAAFFTFPPFLDTRSNPNGPSTCVIGTGQTIFTPLPAFNYANCAPGSGACFFTWADSGPSLQPNYAFIKDFEVYGLQWTLTGTGTNDTVFNLQRVTEENVWLWHWGNSIGSGKTYFGPVSSFSSVSDTSGNGQNCNFPGSGGNQTVQLFTPFCGEGKAALVLGTSAILETFGGQYGNGTTPSVTLSGGAIWHSRGEVIFGGSGTSDTIRLGSGSISLDGDQVFGVAANTFGALDCNASGGSFHYRNSTINGGGTGGFSLRSVAGCNFFDDGGNTIVNPNNSLAGNWLNSASADNTQQVATNWSVPAGSSAGQWGTTPSVLCPGALFASAGAVRIEACTITVGSGTVGANPILTITFPSGSFQSAPSCSGNMTAGTATQAFFKAGVASTSSVTMTYQGTPGASTTIGLLVTCGP